jgi:hypothetical protein
VLVGLLVKEGKALEAAEVAERAHARVLASSLSAVRLERLTPPERVRWEDAVRSFRTARAAIDADAANDWKLPADALARAVSARAERERDLRAALEGAMTLVGGRTPERARRSSPSIELDIYPDLDGFVGIVKHEGSAITYRLPRPEATQRPEDLARALLDPIADRIERARASNTVSPIVVRARSTHGSRHPLARARSAFRHPHGLRGGQECR